MDLASLEFLLRSENRSRSFLVAKCWGKKRGRFCIRCGHRKIYRLAEKRYRCSRCRYTFQDFSGRWIGQLNLSAAQWLRILKLFELEIAAPFIAREVRISYPTALKATQLIRCAILQQDDGFAQLSGQVLLGEFFFRNKARRAAHARPASAIAPVFGISHSGGRVRIAIVNDLSADSLLRETIKAVKTGVVAYTDRFRNYDALVFSASRQLIRRFRTRFGSGQVYIDRREGFWSFAKKRLAQFPASPRQGLTLYLKELEFRYNYRHEQLFDVLAQAAAQLVPNRLVGEKKEDRDSSTRSTSTTTQNRRNV
jgi:transposase